MPGRHIGAQLIVQITAGGPPPQMQVRIDDWQRGIDDVLVQLREPGLIDVRVRIRLWFPELPCSSRSPCLD